MLFPTHTDVAAILTPPDYQGNYLCQCGDYCLLAQGARNDQAGAIAKRSVRLILCQLQEILNL